LHAVEGSVLWLLADNPLAARNLRREAARRRLEQRLFIAGRVGLEQHLARQRAADLFLDTWPCNAHTTASDALWAGLPVLTLAGEAFASRVAASVLRALDLPELITKSAADYERMAVMLATSPALLNDLKNRLQANRLTHSLFDSPRYAADLETAYCAMHARHRAGLPPDHIYVV
jgi:predicted O-linked N-acetylglucosamine transferase (SPINDLY family)